MLSAHAHRLPAAVSERFGSCRIGNEMEDHRMLTPPDTCRSLFSVAPPHSYALHEPLTLTFDRGGSSNYLSTKQTLYRYRALNMKATTATLIGRVGGAC